MWKSRLFWKLVLVYGGLGFAVSATFPVALSNWEEENVIGHVRTRLGGFAALLRDQVEKDVVAGELGSLQTSVQKAAELTRVRVTVVAADGVVIADSNADAETMQNHLNREEFLAAKRTGMGHAIRRSATLGIPFLYVALPIETGGNVKGYVRVAEEVQTIKTRTNMWARRLWGFSFAISLLSAVVTYVLAGRIVRPLVELTAVAESIASGDFSHPIAVRGNDELGTLARAFGLMGDEMADRLTQLEDQNRRMSIVLGGMVEGVLAVDSDSRILVANDACAKLLDIDLDDVVGRPLLEVARIAAIDNAFNATMKDGEPNHKEITLAAPNRRVISMFATPLPMQPRPGAVLVLHDVTELRRLENLRQEFVANVSHELKTPLASIKAYAETLRMGAIDDQENNLRFVERISDQAELLDQLITDLLHLARVEAGREAFQFTTVDLDEVVAECVHRFEPLAQQKQICLSVSDRGGTGSEDAAGVSPVWADRQGVATIVNNLVGNAIKYTPNGGRVTIGCQNEGENVLLTVRDTGIGIAPEHQTRVFERFFRVDKARSRELGGTGLGLAIVKHLAHAFQGDVELESEPQQGSTFRIRLPASNAIV